MKFFDGVFAVDLDGAIEFIQNTSSRYNTPRRLVAFILGKPTDEVMAETFIPNMPYYHCRTERWMDVICPGYTGDVSAKPSKYKCFSEFRPHAFNEFRKEFIEEAGLAYSGGTELFLLYAEVGEKNFVTWEVNDVLVLPFETALKSDAIDTADRFMELLFRIAENNQGPNELCDEINNRLIMEGLKKDAVSQTHEGLRDALQKTFFFCARRRKTES